MRKVLKFEPHLSDRIVSGEKTSTWRFFDDKDLKDGDNVILATRDGVLIHNFGKAKITSVEKRTLNTIKENDWVGHGKLEDPLAHYRKYHGDKIDGDTEFKIVRFEVVEVY